MMANKPTMFFEDLKMQERYNIGLMHFWPTEQLYPETEGEGKQSNLTYEPLSQTETDIPLNRLLGQCYYQLV